MKVNHKELIFILDILETLKNIQIKGFVNRDIRSMGGTHCVCFLIRGNKPIYFDSFGVQPDTFLLIQSPIPIIYHIYNAEV